LAAKLCQPRPAHESARAILHSGSNREPKLRPGEPVAALIQLANERYGLQLRDARPDIFYPDHWGCFGGAIDSGEMPEAALVCELDEELGLKLVESDELTQFTPFTHDFGFAGLGAIDRIYFHFLLREMVGLRLREGAGIGAFEANEALHDLRMVPYDSFALWVHHNRGRYELFAAGENA
jgi:8-oxo-dGTP pyrophosphatase MutT (NUDIX family)